jgi:hypothetical protein
MAAEGLVPTPARGKCACLKKIAFPETPRIRESCSCFDSMAESPTTQVKQPEKESALRKTLMPGEYDHSAL